MKQRGHGSNKGTFHLYIYPLSADGAGFGESELLRVPNLIAEQGWMLTYYFTPKHLAATLDFMAVPTGSREGCNRGQHTFNSGKGG